MLGLLYFWPKSELHAESKSDLELRTIKAQLATAEASLVQERKDKAELGRSTEALLKASTARQKQIAVSSTAAAAGRDSAALMASENAAAAAAAATRAIDQAELESSIIQERLKKMGDDNNSNNSIIKMTLISGFSTFFLGAVLKLFTDRRDHKWQIAAAERQIRMAERTERLAVDHRTDLAQIRDIASAGKADAVAAYRIGNNISEKIASIGLQLRDGILPENPIKSKDGH